MDAVFCATQEPLAIEMIPNNLKITSFAETQLAVVGGDIMTQRLNQGFQGSFDLGTSAQQM